MVALWLPRHGRGASSQAVTEHWSPHWGCCPGLHLSHCARFPLFRLGIVHVYCVLIPDLHHGQQPSNLQQAGARLDRLRGQVVCWHCRRCRYNGQRPVHQTLGDTPGGASPEPTRSSETPHSQLLAYDTPGKRNSKACTCRRPTMGNQTNLFLGCPWT